MAPPKMRLFKDENRSQGIPASNRFLAGVNNADPSELVERGILLPYVFNPQFTWLDYRCWISIYLDPGMVLHKALPQSSQAIDSLASITITDPKLDIAQGQANIVCQSKFADIVQRMATSTYRFCLRGWALRAAYKIPIPGLKTVGGVPAIPDNPQEVLQDNEVVANWGGVPVFFSQWRLWYMVAVPPKQAQTPPPNLAQHIRGDAQLPTSKGIQAPWSESDQNASPGTGLPRTISP